jgi:hypothetical protein
MIRLLLVLLCFYRIVYGQCLISNGDFKSSHNTKGPLLYPDDWVIKGKYIHVLDDRKPYLVRGINGEKKYQFTKDVFHTSDTTKKEILYLGSNIGMFGKKTNQIVSTKIKEPLMKDTLYEISIDVYYFSDECFSYKYYPVFLSANSKLTEKKIKEVQLYTQDKNEFKEQGWRTLRAKYKSNGTELFLILKTDFNYSKALNIFNLQKAIEDNKYGYTIYFDNICIKKIR